VAAVLLAAFAIRVVYIETTPYHAINDAGTYNRLASMVARYGDYNTGSGPHTGAGNSRGPTAYFPPAYPYFLAVSDLITGHQSGHKPAVPPERIEQAVAGTLAVALIGLVALEAMGSPVALAAMILAAVYPVFVELSGILVAENLLIVLELGAVWAMLRARRSHRPLRWIAAAGLLTGLAGLTHQNALLILIPLAVAAAAAARPWRGLRPPRWPAVAAVVVLLLTAALAITPWTIRNAVELHAFVPISDETGLTLVGTYNPNSAAYRPEPYKWRYFLKIPEDATLVRTAGRYPEVTLGDKLTTQALNYIGAHPLAPLAVAYHNTLRMLELEGSAAWQDAALAMGLSAKTARVGVVSFWILALLALAGGFTARARRAPRWIWGVPLLLALSTVLINMETPRFREPIDPFLILLAACGVVTALERTGTALARRRGSGLSGAPIGRGRGAAGMPADR
jgi:4-amino-4-deoxy-L-arabinose transferase-like glycosyltransferase